MRKKNIIITGALGQDGIILSKLFTKKKFKVFGIVKKSKKDSIKGIKYIKISMENPSTLSKTIKKINKTAYSNHIERLMIIGNFMLLCEFDPDEVYRWFMELFIDSYDWVMVPNVYGMSQFADGGLMSSKPYISSSNYILKMSNYKKGEWCIIWDSLFWNFLNKQRDFFIKNPRMKMLLSSYDKMDKIKKEKISHTAKEFLSDL